tara:strand:- start:2556 stop:2783 length:228 start_codon:yes stop_codon:yes gene_type:complete
MPIIVFFSLFFFTTHANAYADPGAGAFIIQALIALAGVVFLYVTYSINFIKKNIKKIKDKFSKKDNEKNEGEDSK